MDDGSENPNILHEFQQNMKVLIGKGNIIRFLKDVWCMNEPLQTKFPRLFMVSNQQNHLIVDVGIWDGFSWMWNLSWRRELYSWEVEMYEELLSVLQPFIIKPENKDRKYVQVPLFVFPLQAIFFLFVSTSPSWSDLHFY